MQKNNGIFKPSRYNQSNKNNEVDDIIFKNLREDDINRNITLEDAIPILSELVNEPNLHFCVGLKR